MVSFEASRSAIAGESLEMVSETMAVIPAFVSFAVVSREGEGGEIGVMAAGAILPKVCLARKGLEVKELDGFLPWM